jgi:hypothetical protein
MFRKSHVLLSMSLSCGLALASAPSWASGCRDTASVSYIGYHVENDDDLMLEFSVFEPHTDRGRVILWHYRVTYSCYQRGPYTKNTLDSAVLGRSSDHHGKDVEFIASMCPLPDHSYPHIDDVEITDISCN